MYVPEAAVVAEAIETELPMPVKLFGPDHEYDVMLLPEADKVSVLPAHTGPFEASEENNGVGFTTAEVVALTTHTPAVAVTVYVPVAFTVADGIEGF